MEHNYNEKLHKRNASHYTNAEKNLVKKQDIIKALNDSGYDTNDQIAVLFNAISLIVDSMPESEHKQELVRLLNVRSAIKDELKSE